MSSPGEKLTAPLRARPLRSPWRGELGRRWVIAVLLFGSTFLNYFDRQTLSVLKPTLKAAFSLDDNGYATVVSGFMITYMFAYALGGRLVDRIGSRASMALFVGVWSAAGLLTGLSQTFGQLIACRVLLGAAEPGNFPAALRATTTWFPAKIRGLGASIYQSGSATASVLAPPLIALVGSIWGWRTAFAVPGVLGLVWVIAWLSVYRSPSKVYARHCRYHEMPGVSWLKLLTDRNVLAIVLARLISDQVWYFCMFWMVGYMQENLHLTLAQVGYVGWVPYLCGDIAGVTSGFLSDRMVRNGLAPWQARVRILKVTAFLTLSAILVPTVPNVVVAMGAFCLIVVASQVWLFNLTTLVSDTFPRTWVASVLGISGSFGALGGLMSTKAIGMLVGAIGFGPVFWVLGFLHLAAALVIRKLLRGPQLEGPRN
jgi:MFS transporter, ACS family, hexuronate transporter